MVQALRDEDAMQQLDRLWVVATAKWYSIFEQVGYPGSLGVALLNCGADDAACIEVIRDALGIRSPRTAIKRASTFSRFLSWMKARNEEVQRLKVAGEYRPARDLLLCEVAMMERSMAVLADPYDRYILGVCLFVLFSRSRWSDVQHLHHLWADRYDSDGAVFGFIEARTRFHKTNSSMEKKLRYMPLVCPLRSDAWCNWY